MAFASPVMKASAAGAVDDSYAQKILPDEPSDPGTPAYETWVEFDFMVPAATIAGWAGTFGPGLMSWRGQTLIYRAGLYFEKVGGTWRWGCEGETTTAVVQPDTVYHVRLNYDTLADTITVHLDGVLIITTSASLSFARYVWIGIDDAFTSDADYYYDNAKISVLGIGGGDILDADFDPAIIPPFDSITGDVTLVSDPTPQPTPDGGRFYESPPWRFLVTDLDSATITFLDRLARDRTVTRTLNEPLTVSGVVPSDNPEINILHTDGDPFLHEGNRLLYCFRRESDDPGSDVVNWICRAGTIILEVDDRGGPDTPETRFVGYDRAMVDENGDLPSEEGFSYNAPGNSIALELLQNSFSAHGEVFIDFNNGTFETTETIEIDFQQGISVGEAWDQLVETGTLDIVLDPLYDPFDFPGLVARMNVYERAGSIKREAIFAWDKPSRSIVDLNRKRDGNERANKVQYYIGQGGPPVLLQTSAPSVTKYGQYWDQQFFPGRDSTVAVRKVAETQKRLRRFGLTTYTMSPAPERAPIPFVDYDIGDTVPIYASSRLREVVADLRRVYSIPLVIANNQMEAPSQILVAEDEEPA
jgi:hypothetical protein